MIEEQGWGGTDLSVLRQSVSVHKREDLQALLGRMKPENKNKKMVKFCVDIRPPL